jgi:uncharacterized protein YndB with AHSA1/START domain
MKKPGLRETTFYPEKIERVWSSLTDPAEVAQWLMRGDFRAEPGHRFVWTDVESGSPAEGAVCEIEAVDAPRRVRYRLEQDDEAVSVVTWSLEEREGGTEVVVEHELVAVAGRHPTVVSLSSWRRDGAFAARWRLAEAA